MRKRYSWLGLVLLAALALSLPAAPAHADTIIEYECNPSSAGWTVVGAWGGGTVMERRVCIRANLTIDNVQAYSYWRTRNGGQSVQSNWELSSTQSWVYSVTTGGLYGERADYGPVFSASYIEIQSYWGCSGTGGTQSYYGQVFDVRADPIGSLPPSNYKDGGSFNAVNNYIDCTP